MESKPQFIARLRTGGFTRSGSSEEVFSVIQKLLPIDKLYMLVDAPDGKGYELLEVGNLVVDFQPSVPVPARTVTEHSPLSQLPLPPPLQEGPQLPSGSNVEPTPIPNPSSADGYAFTPDVEPPKSQSALAVEKGLEPPPAVSLKAKTPKAGKSKKKTKVANKPATAAQLADQCSDDPNDTSWLRGLPPPVRVTTPGVASVTHIRTATPAESAAADLFGKGF